MFFFKRFIAEEKINKDFVNEIRQNKIEHENLGNIQTGFSKVNDNC